MNDYLKRADEWCRNEKIRVKHEDEQMQSIPEFKMPLESPTKPQDAFPDTESYHTSGEEVKLTSELPKWDINDFKKMTKEMEYLNGKGYYFGDRVPAQDMLDGLTESEGSNN